MEIIINLTEAEAKALAHVAVDPQSWAENVVKTRCRVAIDDIVDKEVKRKLDAGESITGSRDDIVLAADIKPLAEIEADHLASLEQKLAVQK